MMSYVKAALCGRLVPKLLCEGPSQAPPDMGRAATGCQGAPWAPQAHVGHSGLCSHGADSCCWCSSWGWDKLLQGFDFSCHVSKLLSSFYIGAHHYLLASTLQVLYVKGMHWKHNFHFEAYKWHWRKFPERRLILRLNLWCELCATEISKGLTEDFAIFFTGKDWNTSYISY